MTQVYSGLGGSEKARGPGDVWGGVEEAQASHLGATSPQILIKAMKRGALPEDRRDPRNILEEHPHGGKWGRARSSQRKKGAPGECRLTEATQSVPQAWKRVWCNLRDATHFHLRTCGVLAGAGAGAFQV